MSRHSSESQCPGCAPRPRSRRDVLKYASNGFGLMALSALMSDKAYADLAAPKLHFEPKIKNVIFCFMPGAVSHVDTFDPKPKLRNWMASPSMAFTRWAPRKKPIASG